MTITDYTALSAEIRAELARRVQADQKLSADYQSLLDNWDAWGNIDFLEVAALNAYGWGAMSNHLTDARRDLETANAQAAQAERDRDALMEQLAAFESDPPATNFYAAVDERISSYLKDVASAQPADKGGE